jgi:hypothetical protein
MTELIIYILLLIAILAHVILATMLYKRISKDQALSFHEKNNWRLKALTFPAYFWIAFKKRG